jgi:hypothetical protein
MLTETYILSLSLTERERDRKRRKEEEERQSNYFIVYFLACELYNQIVMVKLRVIL